MKKWPGWRQEYANEKYDVIIIGSGISGLTAGVLLASRGKKVLILEHRIYPEVVKAFCEDRIIFENNKPIIEVNIEN